MAANCPESGLNSRVGQSICCCDHILMVKMLKRQQANSKEKLSSLQKISKEHKQLFERKGTRRRRRRRRGKRRERNNNEQSKSTLTSTKQILSLKKSPEEPSIKRTFSPQSSPSSITFLLIIIKCLLTLTSLPFAAAQCPWTRETAELHSDCICDFNPSQTTNLQSQHLINRMSVQCSPVNFQQLLKALKQSASIELPKQLLNLNQNLLNDRHTTSSVIKQLDYEDEHIKEAALQLVSQTKLDLLHVSNSSIKLLTDNTFIMDLRTNAESTTAGINNNGSTIPLEVRHLVVAIQSLHLIRCGIENIQADAFNGLEWSLTSLSLSDNQLETIPVTALRKLINLKVLDLSNNRLFHIKANSFATLNKLNTLRLADNNRLGQQQQTQSTSSISMTTSSSTSIVFAGIPKGRHSINNNTIQAIDLQAFVGLEASLTDLNLKNTHLESFPMAIKTLRNLAFLNLAQNQISHIPPRSFEFINSLTAINIERNRISNIENDTFLGVENSLSSLSLLGNLLEIYPVNQLSKLSFLRRLDIGFNRIETLPIDSFVSNKRLILIALDGNPLESLPELTFRPLEGILTGLSIGGKNLNCDCNLSWMLRWQMEYNLQISSREREPQFCGKPHYLRSLVSFKALKPEHLTCSSGDPMRDFGGGGNNNVGQTINPHQANPDNAIYHQRQQPAYTIQKANYNVSLSSANKWTANDPQANSYSYFTLPVQFAAPESVTATTRLATPNWTNQVTARNRGVELAANGLEGPSSTSQTTISAAAAAATTTNQPEITKPMTVSLLNEPRERSTTIGNNIVEDKQSPIDSHSSPPVGFTEYLGTTDLSEASTNEEPTLRNEQQVAATTELNVLEPTSLAMTTLSAQQQVSEMLSTPNMKNVLSELPTTNLLGVASLYGERTLTSSSNNDNLNATESSFQVGRNGLAGLPDDELFANNNGYGVTTRKTNRHGYLASSQPETGGHHQRSKFSSSSSSSSSSLTQAATSMMLDEIFRSPVKQEQTTVSKQSSTISDLFRRNNIRGGSSTTTTIAPAFEPSSSTSSGATDQADSGMRLRPIKSVFGSRAGENTNKREYRRPTTSIPQQQPSMRTWSSTSSPPVVPAVPTTVNFYKMQHQLQSSSSNNNNQSSSSSNQQQSSPLNSSPASSQPLKGARLIDEALPSFSTISTRSYSSRSPSLIFNQTTGKHVIDQPHLVDSDIERYAATSNMDTRVPSNNANPSQLASTKLSIKKIPLKGGQKDSEWETTTLPTSLESNNEQHRQFTTAQVPPQTAPTTQANRMFANNTRMSVSSMYRLAINSLRQQQGSTTVAPSLVNQNVTRILVSSSPAGNLEAAAENESQKITRSPTLQTETPTLPFLLTTAHRPQFMPNRAASVDNGRIISALNNSTNASESAPRVSWTSSTGVSSNYAAQTGRSESQTTNFEPTNEQKLAQNSTFPSELAAMTTRMATTIRFVDSSPPLVRISSSQTSTASNTSFANNPTIWPQLVTRNPAKVVSSSSSSANGAPVATTITTGNNSSTKSGPPFLIESIIPALELSKFGTISPRELMDKVSQTVSTRMPPSTTTSTTTTKRPDFHKMTHVAVVGEQQHEARLTLVSVPKTTKQPILHAVGSHVVQPIDQEPQPTTTSSVPTLDESTSNIQQDSASKLPKDNISINHQRQGRDDSSAFSVFAGNSSSFMAKLVRMADFDQLALILAGLLCLFILILALTIVCICYSSWLTGKKRAKKNNTSSSRLSSSLSSNNNNLDSSTRQHRELSSSSSSAPANFSVVSGQYLLKRSWLSRALSYFCCLCFCSGRRRASSNKRITPMRSLILQDDDNSSGSSSSSSNDINGLRATGKSMLLNNPNNFMSQDLDLLDSIRDASMRVASTGGTNEPQLINLRGSKQTTGKNGNNTATTGRKSKLAKHGSRVQSYDDIDCVFTSSKPFDRDISGQKHRQASNEYFVGVAPAQLSAKSIGRRRSMLDASGSSGALIGAGGGGGQREVEGGDDEETNMAGPNDWTRGDTLSSCDSDKSCSPGANRNNRYNISEAHRAYLESKNGGPVQSRMFVTTCSRPSKSSSGLLLRTIEQNSNNHHQQHNYLMQPDTGSNMAPPVDYFDRISRMSQSDKSTTDDSRAPLSNTTKNSHRSTGGRNSHHLHQQATTRDGTTRTFKAPQSQVKRSRSIGNNRVLIQPPLEHNLMPIGGEISADYINSDLVPMSAEEQWPEPYIDPADQEEAPRWEQQQVDNAFSGLQNQYVQFQRHQATANGQHQQTSVSVRSQSVLNSGSQRGKSNKLAAHKRTGSSGVTNQAFTHHDDAYLSNWHTISRSRQRAGYSTRDQASVLTANEDLFQNHPDPLANNQSTLIRYRSIPSLNGFPQQHDNQLQQQQSNNQLLSGQIGGATNWLRWTPTSFLNQRGLIDNNSNGGSDNGGNLRKQSKNADDIATNSSDTSNLRAQNNGQVMSGWHRDNFVEAVYVAPNQQR